MRKALNQRQEISVLISAQCIPSRPWQLWEQQAQQVSQKQVATSLVDQLRDTRSPLQPIITDMRRLTTGIRSEKCVVSRFRRCANIIDYTYTNLDSTV
jgi:hypothetical protein